MTARKQPDKVTLVWISLKQTTRIMATLVMTHSRSCRRKDHQPHRLCRGCMHQVSYYALFLFASELLIYSRNVPERIGIQVACMQSPFSSFFPSAFPSLPFLSSPPSAPSPPSFCTCMEPSHPPAWQAVAGALSKRCLVWRMSSHPSLERSQGPIEAKRTRQIFRKKEEKMSKNGGKDMDKDKTEAGIKKRTRQGSRVHIVAVLRSLGKISPWGT